MESSHLKWQCLQQIFVIRPNDLRGCWLPLSHGWDNALNRQQLRGEGGTGGGRGGLSWGPSSAACLPCSLG